MFNAEYNLAKLWITGHRTTHYSQFHLLAEFSKNLYRRPFFPVCGEDELKWKFKPDTLVSCLPIIFLQLSWKTPEALVGTRSLSANGRCAKVKNDFYVTRHKLLFKMI